MASSSRSREGFLGMYTKGLMKTVKKRWCVLCDGNFMWFKDQSKEEPLGCIELEEILSVGASAKSYSDGSPIFVIVTQNGSHKIIAPNDATVNAWVGSLNPKRPSLSLDGTEDAGDYEGVPREVGWMNVGNAGSNSTKRRWCVVKGAALQFFKDKDEKQKEQVYRLDGRCTVIPSSSSSDRAEVTIHLPRNTSLVLEFKSVADSERWVSCLQDAIEASFVTRSTTEQLMDKLKAAKDDNDKIDEIFQNENLRYSDGILNDSILSLPYGSSVIDGTRYNGLPTEAVLIWGALSDPHCTVSRYSNMSKPQELFLNVLKACIQLPRLATEVVCQLCKLTCHAPDTPLTMMWWKLLACFNDVIKLPPRFTQFLATNLNYTIRRQQVINKEIVVIATYILKSLRKPKRQMEILSPGSVNMYISGQAFESQVKNVGGWIGTEDSEI